MPFDYREISQATRKALVLIEDPERRRIIEEFLDSTAPLVEVATSEALQALMEEINAQLGPQNRIRLFQEGTRVVAEVLPMTEEHIRARIERMEGETISKLLVRMPSSIKERATESARRAGVSLNSWTVSILERTVENLKTSQPGNQAAKTNDSNSGESGT